MGSRRPAAQLRPAEPQIRRSARIQAATNQIIPVTNSKRVTKSKPALKPKPPKADCITCGRTLAASSFLKHLPTDSCKHESNTCKACVKNWIATQLNNTTYDKLSCPECPEMMQNGNVKKHAAKDVYMRFDELERKDMAEKIPGWRWCMAPKCRAGQVHKPLMELSPNAASVKAGKSRKKAKKGEKTAGDNVCICKECGAKACVSCDRPWHEDETCAQFQLRAKRQTDGEETATLKFISKECRQCPKCKKNIERNGGCDHMRCSMCSATFCWLCLTTYDVINTQGHAKKCQYAQPNRIDPHAMLANGGLGGLIGGVWHGIVGN